MPDANVKRCLLVITGAFGLTGGIAASTQLAIYALIDAGYQLDIFAFNEGSQNAKVYHALEGINYWAADNNKMRFALAVWRALLLKRYEFAFSDHINVASILAPAALLSLIRYVVRVHLIEAVPPNPDFQGRLGLRFAWRIHASEYAKREVLKLFPNLQIDVVPLALDPGIRFDLPDNSPKPDLTFAAVDDEVRQLHSRVILLVGRMASTEQYKGQDTLIQAMPLILEQCPEAQLVLAGKGDDLPRLLRLVQAQPREVQARIFMPGFVSDEQLDHLYQSAYLFAMPSRGEGFGVVYLEAMRWAKPCVASRVDAAQYIVEDGKTGRLVDDATNPHSVAKTIVELLLAPEQAARLGQAGYERVKAEYTFNQFQKHFLAALEPV